MEDVNEIKSNDPKEDRAQKLKKTCQEQSALGIAKQLTKIRQSPQKIFNVSPQKQSSVKISRNKSSMKVKISKSASKSMHESKSVDLRQ
jgi:hypothetical protein